MPSNNILVWEGLPGANTLVYYENSKPTAVQSFITLATGGKSLPGANALAYSALDAKKFDDIDHFNWLYILVGCDIILLVAASLGQEL